MGFSAERARSRIVSGSNNVPADYCCIIVTLRGEAKENGGRSYRVLAKFFVVQNSDVSIESS